VNVVAFILNRRDDVFPGDLTVVEADRHVLAVKDRL